MKKIEAERIAKEVSDEPSDKLVDSVQDLVENRNQSYEYIEKTAKNSGSEDEFFLTIIQEVLLDGTSYEGMKKINKNLKKKLDDSE